MASPVLQFKRGALLNLPGLRAGEPGITTDTYDFYVGIDSTTNNNKFFGSYRYWTKETASTGSAVNLVENTGGTDYISLKSPDTLAGITTYTFPATATNGYFLKTNANGVLSWESITSSATFENATLTGVTTITNAVVQGGSINNTTVGLTTAAAGQFTTLGANSLNVSGIATVGSVSIGATEVISSTFQLKNIASLDATTTATIEAAVANAPNTFTDLNITGITTLSSTTITDLSVSGVTTISSAVINGGAINATTIGLTTAAAASFTDLNVSGIATFTSTVTGTISTATRATQVDTTATSANANYYIPFVTNATSTTGETIRVGAGLSFNPSSNDLTVGGNIQINGNLIKSSAGETVATLSGNDVSFVDDVTVGGNLYVNGNTTQVNTTAISVEDRTIDLGIVDGAAPTSATTWDLGVLFNYYSGGSAKKSAVVWEHGDTRFKFASLLASDTNGTDNNTPQLTVTTFAPIEIGALWVNDCAGSSQVINCAAGVRTLENITIDAGTF